MRLTFLTLRSLVLGLRATHFTGFQRIQGFTAGNLPLFNRSATSVWAGYYFVEPGAYTAHGRFEFTTRNGVDFT
ncbi:MAG: hypothetical protein ABGY96_12630, partial [bacterium]